MEDRRINLLVVESNPADAYLTVESLKQAGFNQAIQVIEDGQQALEYLAQSPAPDLIFLDLNLAAMTGFEVLEAIRNDPKLECVPVIVISGSQNAEDVRKAYRLKANCYLTKPAKLADFLRFMKICYEFWGTVATLPPASPGANQAPAK